MKHSKQELIDSIKDMKEVYHDADTPQSLKDSIKASLDTAEGLLRELEAAEKPAATEHAKEEKPTAKEIVAAAHAGEKKVRKVKVAIEKKHKAPVVKMNKRQKRTLQQVVASAAKFSKYLGKSESDLERDASRKAKQPGSRTSKTGHKYREYRPNRADVNKSAPHLGKGGQTSKKAKLVEFESMYSGKVKAYESVSQKDLYFYVDEQSTNSFIVVGEAKGYPASEALDDWFGNHEDAMAAAKDLAEGKDPGGDEYGKGGAVASDQIEFGSYKTSAMTADGKAAFERAFADLEREDKEGPHYKTAKEAMRVLLETVDNVLASSNPMNVHNLLQSVGIYNYKTGLLLDTRWLSVDLARRHMAGGGGFNQYGEPYGFPDPEDDEFEDDDDNQDEDLGGTGHGDESYSDADPGMAQGGPIAYHKDWEVTYITLPGKQMKKIITLGRKSDELDVKQALKRMGNLNIREVTSIKEMRTYAKGGRIKSALARDRKYKSNQPWEQSYHRRTRPTNPRYKAEGGEVDKHSQVDNSPLARKNLHHIYDTYMDRKTGMMIGDKKDYDKGHYKKLEDLGLITVFKNPGAYSARITTKGIQYVGGGLASGGEVKFKDKVEAISGKLEGTKVPGKYRPEYGKRYGQEDAIAAARKIAGSMKKNEMGKGGEAPSGKQFLAVDNSGRDYRATLDEGHIRQTWNLADYDDNEDQTLEDFLNDCEVGDSWTMNTDTLTCIGDGKMGKGGEMHPDDLDAMMMKKGYEFSNTGGGLTAYIHNFKNGTSIYITDEGEIPTKLSQTVTVSTYDADDQQVGFGTGKLSDVLKKEPFDLWEKIGEGENVELFSKGGATRGRSRDRKFKSKEPWEQKYQRKTTPKNPHYKKPKKKGAINAARSLVKSMK